MEHIKVKLAQRPERTILVPQATFGSLAKDVAQNSGFDRLETHGSKECVGLVLFDRSNTMTLLAHVDEYTSEKIAGSISRELPGSRFDEAVVVLSATPTETLELSPILSNVQAFILNNVQRNKRIVQPSYRIDFGVTLDGTLYVPSAMSKEFPVATGYWEALNSARKSAGEGFLPNINRIHEELLRKEAGAYMSNSP